ncbi:hypothetical protein GCM10027022_05710 [Alpinimonas psychrophila]
MPNRVHAGSSHAPIEPYVLTEAPERTEEVSDRYCPIPTILTKLNLISRLQIASFAYETGLLR